MANEESAVRAADRRVEQTRIGRERARARTSAAGVAYRVACARGAGEEDAKSRLDLARKLEIGADREHSLSTAAFYAVWKIQDNAERAERRSSRMRVAVAV